MAGGDGLAYWPPVADVGTAWGAQAGRPGQELGWTVQTIAKLDLAFPCPQQRAGWLLSSTCVRVHTGAAVGARRVVPASSSVPVPSAGVQQVMSVGPAVQAAVA